MKYYLLEGKEIKETLDIHIWAKNWEKNRILFRTEIYGVTISTIFLGMDHGWKSELPILFETMVFEGRYDGQQLRYPTYKDAEEGHKNYIKWIKNVGILNYLFSIIKWWKSK